MIIEIVNWWLLSDFKNDNVKVIDISISFLFILFGKYKTEAAVVPTQAMLPKDFPVFFFQIILSTKRYE